MPIAAPALDGDPGRWMHGTIVCAVTESPDARAAVQVAAALAERLDLRLVLVHVVEHGHEAHSLAALAGEWPQAELRVVPGNRVDALAQVAADEGADVIVVGSHGRGARGRVLRCRLARELEAVQRVPVLVAPPATHAPSARRLTLADTPAPR